MTHENEQHAEVDGPEQDVRLPDAASIPVYDDPEDSFDPPLEGDLVDDGRSEGLFDRLPPAEED